MSLLDNLIANEIISRMSGATSDTTRLAIKNNDLLFKNVTEEEWAKQRARARLVPGLKLDYNSVVDALAKNRADILAAIVSTKGGIPWLKEQVRIGNEKLGLIKPQCRFQSRENIS